MSPLPGGRCVIPYGMRVPVAAMAGLPASCYTLTLLYFIGYRFMRNTECWNDSLTSQLSTRLIRMEMMAIPITSYDASFPIPIPIPNLPNHIFCPLD